MKVEVLGKNGFTPSEANKEYAEKKLSKLDNFLEMPDLAIARVVCKIYKEGHKVEVTIPAKGMVLRAEALEQHLYAAIDEVVDKLLGQIRKYKTRISRKGKEGIRSQDIPVGEETLGEVVRQKDVELTPMTRDEAIEQMELLGHNFFVYLDKHSHKVHVIYLRNDGNYAVIETK